MEDMTDYWYGGNVNDSLRKSSQSESCMRPEEATLYGSADVTSVPCSELRYVTEQHWYSNTLWPAAPTRSTKAPSMCLSAEGSVFVDPGLSSTSTSRGSSINPPSRPNAYDVDSTWTRPDVLSPHDAAYSNEYFFSPSLQSVSFGPLYPETRADRSFEETQTSTLIYPSIEVSVPMSAATWPDYDRQQVWEEPFPVMSRLDFQQATPVPPPWSVPRMQSSHETNTLARTRQRHENPIRPFGKEGALTLEASDTNNCSLTLTASNCYQDINAVQASDEPRQISSSFEEQSHTKQDYLPVQCKQCDKIYTGRYGTNNMQRHVRLKHAYEIPKGYRCVVCKKTFNRSDALGNHERQKHPGLGRAPVLRRFAS